MIELRVFWVDLQVHLMIQDCAVLGRIVLVCEVLVNRVLMIVVI